MQVGSIVEDATILRESEDRFCLVICCQGEEQVRFHGNKKILNLDIQLIKGAVIEVCGLHAETGNLHVAFKNKGIVCCWRFEKVGRIENGD